MEGVFIMRKATEIYNELIEHYNENNFVLFTSLFDIYCGENFTYTQLNELSRLSEEILKKQESVATAVQWCFVN